MREFHNEMRLLASIRHPHVVQLLGYAAEGQTQCLVYELMARGSLEDILVGKVMVTSSDHSTETTDSFILMLFSLVGMIL
jgi:serine/threonine protein kinase